MIEKLKFKVYLSRRNNKNRLMILGETSSGKTSLLGVSSSGCNDNGKVIY
jgi:polynucleotide 5'-kinase involved in rRNA processing